MMPAPTLSENISLDLLHQQRLVEALLAPGYFSGTPKLEETHISWVLLTGRDAYKIKKSVDLGFLDFSTLALRRFYCDEELRLNRRFAPELYLDVIAIGGSVEQPVLGGEPILEYAVHMRRFAQSRIMDRLLARDLITPEHIDKLAEIIANFHSSLPPAAADSSHCDIATIHAAVFENFTHLPSLLNTPDDLDMLKLVRLASEAAFTRCAPLLRLRAATGRVRECHGDLHLGNIAVLNDMPTPFDCIEFSAALRWIDVISEISFTVMDLLQRGQPTLAWRLLNGYLERSGDYQGCGVLRFYLAYRAMVRAKIAAIRGHQLSVAKALHELKQCRSYLGLAHECLTRHRAAIIVTHGLPGCGKSSFAQLALEKLGAIRIRSDIERKRLFGLPPLADSKVLTDVDIYSQEATRRTYARLLVLAREVIAAGLTVIVDAAFLLYAERENFRVLATELAVPFVIASLQTDATLLAERLVLRQQQGNDASEADVSVMQKLQHIQEPLREAEQPYAVIFVNNGDIDALSNATAAWDAIKKLVG